MLKVKAGRTLLQIDGNDVVSGDRWHEITTRVNTTGSHPRFSNSVFNQLVLISVLIPHEDIPGMFRFNIPLMEQMRVYNTNE